MGLLEKLSADEPYKSRELMYPWIYELIRKHYEELTEAVKEKYSWTQITKRALEAWTESGELKTPLGFTYTTLYNYYKRVRKEREHGSPAINK